MHLHLRIYKIHIVHVRYIVRYTVHVRYFSGGIAMKYQFIHSFMYGTCVFFLILQLDRICLYLSSDHSGHSQRSSSGNGTRVNSGGPPGAPVSIEWFFQIPMEEGRAAAPERRSDPYQASQVGTVSTLIICTRAQRYTRVGGSLATANSSIRINWIK